MNNIWDETWLNRSEGCHIHTHTHTDSGIEWRVELGAFVMRTNPYIHVYSIGIGISHVLCAPPWCIRFVTFLIISDSKFAQIQCCFIYYFNQNIPEVWLFIDHITHTSAHISSGRTGSRALSLAFLPIIFNEFRTTQNIRHYRLK